MTTTERGTQRGRRKSCHTIASQRARHARRQGRSRTIAMLVFVWAFLSGPFRLPPVASQPARGPSFPPSASGRGKDDDWPVTDYERGAGGHLMRPRPIATSGTERYVSRPSLTKLMVDLRRPAARRDAAVALMARVPDTVTRAWAADRIAKGEIKHLSIWVQPGRMEAHILAAWRSEAEAALDKTASGSADLPPDRDNLLQVAKLLEALAGTETVTTDGPKRPGHV